MKTVKLKKTELVTLLLLVGFSLISFSQVGGWNPELQKDSEQALQKMLEKTPRLKTFKEEAFGYAIFPKVTKAGVGLGGALGKGLVYKQDTLIGKCKLKQASFGWQFGGEQYSEVLFFKDENAFNRFINGKVKFDAQASAVAIENGASVDAAYHDGVGVFTQTKGGLMFDASIGGQHFKYKSKRKNK